MSPVVLDTHVFVWLFQGENRISAEKRNIIQKAANTSSLYVAAITPWEIAMLVAKSRLALPMDFDKWLAAAFSKPGMGLIPLSPEIAVASNRLPGNFHSDPADQMIVASARHLNALLITEDRAILAYAVLGHIQATPAS